MSWFKKSSPLPRVAPDVQDTPVRGGVEEALSRLSQDPTFDLVSFQEEAKVMFVSLRHALWNSDRDEVFALTTPACRLRTLVEATRARKRRTEVDDFTLLDFSVVRAPEGSDALTVRFHYTTSQERLVHLESGALFQASPGSHHKEDVTFLREDGHWAVSALSVIS